MTAVKKQADGSGVSAIDAVTLEVVRAGLNSIVHEMTITLGRTSYSTIIREVHDFSCVLFDSQGRLIAQAEGIPIFNGSMNFVIDAITERFPLSAMKPGDIYMSNDPYSGGGTHKNDINILMPVFWEGALVMLAANKAHHLDIGGKDPGSWSSDAQNTYQEGISIPPVKLADAGKMNGEIQEILFSNMRVPHLSRGDLAAQIAAGKTAEIRAHAWLEKNGVELFTRAVDALLEHGERITRAAIEKIPDGVYMASGFSDADGVSDEPIPICVTVTVENRDITIDFTGSGEQRNGASGNCHWVNTVSMSRETIMFLADTSLGANEGSYRPIHIKAEPGSVFRPLHPAPVTTGMGDVGTRLIELILQALADVLPGEVIGGTFGCFSCMTISGQDPKSDQEFVHFWCGAGGWGGRETADGNTAMVSLGSGDNYNIPIEVMETKFPALLAERYQLQESSAGAGKHRGGFGIIYDYRITVPGQFTIALDRNKYPPYGLFGGQSGGGSELVVNPGTDKEARYIQKSAVAIAPGTLLSHRTAGGGGYGNPLERDPALVLDDVANELITIEEAQELYGVVLDAGGLAVDAVATAALRGRAST